jgi:hypothetical protein
MATIDNGCTKGSLVKRGGCFFCLRSQHADVCGAGGNEQCMHVTNVSKYIKNFIGYPY